jgi:hypothetical protein
MVCSNFTTHKQFNNKQLSITMRKLSLHLFSLFAVIGLFTMTSCDKEVDTIDPVPTVTIPQAAATTAKVGDKVTFNVAVVAQAKIRSIETRLGTSTLGTAKTTGFTNSTSDSYPFEYIVKDTDAGKNLQFAFIVTDSKDRTAQANYTLNVPVVGSIRTQNAQLLYGQANTTGGSFYTTEATGTVYKQADAKTNAAKVDFLYFYGASNLATIAAPSDADARTMYNNATTGLQTWTKLNNTKFVEKTMTKAEFDAATFASIDAAVTTPTATRINSLSANKVIGFVTEGGKKGLIFVNSITGTTDGNINITIKIQD